MTLSPLGKYALRSLTRHSRRTLLSVLGIGIGCAVALIATAYIRGEGDLIERAAALSGTGHLRISPAGWLPQRDDRLRLRDWQQALAIARQTPGVAAATPRARSNGLLAFGTRVAGVEIVGVDPATEPRLNRVVRSIGAGRYLRLDDRGATVIGQGVADRLRVRLDDELLVTVAARDGNLQSAILRIVGIVRTGSQTVDATVCQIRLPELEALTGRPGAAEVAVLLERSEEMPTVQAALRESAAYRKRGAYLD
jgi:ABC-type lipoprotein release transport system permease subunit